MFKGCRTCITKVKGKGTRAKWQRVEIVIRIFGQRSDVKTNEGKSGGSKHLSGKKGKIRRGGENTRKIGVFGLV